jgi:hypothetical protein
VHIGPCAFWSPRIDEALDSQLKFNNSKHKEFIKTEKILKRLTSVTLLLASQELPCRGHDESDSSLNRGNYRSI